MLKVEGIQFLDSQKILCFFNTGEKKILDIRLALDQTNNLVKKLVNPDVFKNAKIGLFGEIYWDQVGEIKELDGSVSSCAYDISPEFAYHHSVDYSV
jgi:hypothetical protein